MMTQGPPKGYEPCIYKCGRWTSITMSSCNVCLCANSGGTVAEHEESFGPDWIPPVTPDRSGCKPWCGRDKNDALVNEHRMTDEFAHGNAPLFMIGIGKADNGRWCSPACRDARLPPIEAASTTRFTGAIDYGYEPDAAVLVPAPVEAPKTMEAVRPRCVYVEESTCNGSIALRAFRKHPARLICEGHALEKEGHITGLMDALAPSAAKHLPGDYTLPKVRMACDWTWDCLPEAGR